MDILNNLELFYFGVCRVFRFLVFFCKFFYDAYHMDFSFCEEVRSMQTLNESVEIVNSDWFFSYDIYDNRDFLHGIYRGSIFVI